MSVHPIKKSNTDEAVFASYSKKILSVIKEALLKENLNEIQSLAIFLNLSNARNIDELKASISSLQKKYPVLDEINFLEREANQTDFENTLQMIISSLIKAGKTKEAEHLIKNSGNYQGNIEKLTNDYNLRLN